MATTHLDAAKGHRGSSVASPHHAQRRALRRRVPASTAKLSVLALAAIGLLLCVRTGRPVKATAARAVPAQKPTFTWAWTMGDPGRRVVSGSESPVWVSWRGLQTLHVTSTGAMVFTGQLRLPPSYNTSVTDGATLYFFDTHLKQLAAADISTPEQPQLRMMPFDSSLLMRSLIHVRGKWFFFEGNDPYEADDNGRLVTPYRITVAQPDSTGRVTPLGELRLTLPTSFLGRSVTIGRLEFDGARYLYVVLSDGTIEVVDLVDPAAPKVIAQVMPPGESHATETLPAQVWLHGGALFTTDERYLYAWAVADPAEPRLMATLELGCTVRDFVVAGDIAWLLRFRCGTDLAAVDLANPAQPRLLGAWRSTPSGYSSGLTLGLAGDLALIDRGTGGLVMARLSPSAGPQVVATLPNPLGRPRRLAVGHGRTVSASSWAVDLLNTGEPDKPASAGSFTLPRVLDPAGQPTSSQPSVAAFTARGIVVAATNPYLHVFETASDGQLRYVSLLPITVGAAPARCTRLSIEGSRAGALCQPLSATWQPDGAVVAAVFDLSGLPSQLPPGTVVQAEAPEDVVMSGTRLLVADGQAGLRVIDATDASAPVLTATVPMSGTARAVATDGSVAYLATGAGGGLETVALNEATPRRLAVLATGGNATAVATAGGYAFVADPPIGVVAFDVRDPRTPAQVALADMASDADQVLVVGGDHVLAVTPDGVVTALRFSGLQAAPVPTGAPPPVPATPSAWPAPWLYLPFASRNGGPGPFGR